MAMESERCSETGATDLVYLHRCSVHLRLNFNLLESAMEESSLQVPKDSEAIQLVDKHDYISTLPNDILHHIFADFQIMDLVQASVLSKRWRHLWASMPYLNFDQSQLSRIPALEGKFVRFVSGVLSLRSEIATLKMTSTEKVDGWILSRWMQIVDKRNVKEIDLDVIPCSLALGSYVPLLGFGKSLLALRLNLHHQRVRIQMNCGMLKTLHLSSVVFPSTSFVLEIFKRCPLIEDFSMERCILHFYEVLEITSCSLKNFVFVNTGQGLFPYEGSFVGTLVVSTPKLLTFMYCGGSLHDYFLENLSSLEEASVHCLQFEDDMDHNLCRMVRGFYNTSILRLTFPIFEDYSPRLWHKCFTAMFCNLKHLELLSGSKICYMLTIIHLLNHFPNVQSLSIDTGFEMPMGPSDLSQPLQWFEEFPCLRCHLKKLELHNTTGSRTEVELIKQCLACGTQLEELIITYQHDEEAKIKEFQQVVFFRRASPYVKLSFKKHEAEEPFWWKYA